MSVPAVKHEPTGISLISLAAAFASLAIVIILVIIGPPSISVRIQWAIALAANAFALGFNLRGIVRRALGEDSK